VSKLHYTEAFKSQVLAPVEALIAEEGGITDNVRLLFRDKCLEIGHLERVRNLYRVSHKVSQEATFFVPNGPQERYLATKTNRSIIVKIRQVGFTTLSCIRALDLALFEANMKTGILAHTEKVVGTIFADLVKFSYNWFKKDWAAFYSPKERTDSASSLSFSEDGMGRALDSNIRVLFDFRGKTVNFLHVSEASRIENERLLGSLNGVPDNGEIIFESTPYGRGGEFYRQWQLHKSMGSLAPYKGHFIPWFDYYPEEPGKWEFPTGTQITEVEKSLKSMYNLSDAHLAWRRYCIETKCQGDVEKFDNEYPTDDVTCFFTGENQVFSKEMLVRVSRTVRPPSKVGHLVVDGKKLVFQDDPKGLVSIWHEPDPSSDYVAGCDPSSGLGKDKGSVYVLNRTTKSIVARIWGYLEPADMANELWKLLKYYNNAWVCPEANNHGHVILHVLKLKNYKNIYRRKTLDSISQKLATQYGFLTTNESKLMVTEKLKTAVKDGKILITDNDLLDEMSSFVQIASKLGRSIKREAASGKHDDLVMAIAFAWEMAEQRGDYVTEDDEYSLGEDFADFDSDTGFMNG
jgi:hypothetical protein